MGVTVCFYTAKCSRILVRLKVHANCALSTRLITRRYQPQLSVIGVMKKWYARLSSIEYTPIK